MRIFGRWRRVWWDEYHRQLLLGTKSYGFLASLTGLGLAWVDRYECRQVSKPTLRRATCQEFATSVNVKT